MKIGSVEGVHIDQVIDVDRFAVGAAGSSAESSTEKVVIMAPLPGLGHVAISLRTPADVADVIASLVDCAGRCWPGAKVLP